MLLTLKAGQPAFGRKSAVLSARRLHPDLPVSRESARVLESGHLAYTRGKQAEEIAADEGLRIIREVNTLLDYLEALCGEK